MLKGETIYLRLFEPDDFEKTYMWHSDFELQKSTCGPMRLISKEIEKNWVISKANNNQRDIYLAICSLESDQMIGWISINDIDHRNRKCSCGGIMIGDKKYQDGMAYLEASKMMHRYVFEELNINMLQGACLEEHVTSISNMEANYYVLEGVERQAVYKEGKYKNVCHYSLSSEDYFYHMKVGDYADTKLIRRMVIIAKEIRNKNK